MVTQAQWVLAGWPCPPHPGRGRARRDPLRRVLHGADQELQHPRRLCPRGFRLLPGARGTASSPRHPAGARRHLHRADRPRALRPEREAAARRHPHAVRLASGRPGGATQPGGRRARSEAQCRQGQDPHADARRGQGPARQYPDRQPGGHARPGADRHPALHLCPCQRGGGHASGDYYPVGRRWWLRLHEKGGKHHEMPCHHTLQEYLDAYLEVASIEADKRGPLFRTAEGRTGRLRSQAMSQPDVYRMIQRRAEAAGVATKIGCHSWRARGITAYLENGGLLEHAQQMAGHASARTTKLYDRRNDRISLDEVERIAL
ncbi:tyrosine-type recombinase/integrase [Siccirubricoccus deserti]